MSTLPLAPERRRGERCCTRDVRPRLTPADAEALTGDLAILAHPVRLQLLEVLVRNAGRVCVCDLEASVPVKQPTVSHHLKLLREAGLIEGERQGVWTYYTVDRDALDALRARIADGLDQLG